MANFIKLLKKGMYFIENRVCTLNQMFNLVICAKIKIENEIVKTIKSCLLEYVRVPWLRSHSCFEPTWLFHPHSPSSKEQDNDNTPTNIKHFDSRPTSCDSSDYLNDVYPYPRNKTTKIEPREREEKRSLEKKTK